MRLSPAWPLEGIRGPLIAGVVGVAVTWWVWGRWAPLPVYHDEIAYVLQAETFAKGRWASAPPPMAEPFEEYHVLVQPVFAAKYHPGQSAALTPGVILGWAALGPLVLSGLTGAFVFTLARNLAGVPVAALATLLWLLAPMNLRFRSSYLSEVTTTLLWVGGLLALHRWNESGGRSWLAALSLVVSACLLTRPLTGLVLAVLAAAVVLSRIGSVGRPKDLVFPGALALTVPVVLALWNWRTTGDLWQSPRDLYTAQYMPWDRPGFGLDSTPPALALSPDLKRFTAQFHALHANHTLSRAPLALVERTTSFVRESLGAGAAILALCLIVGAFRRPTEAVVGLGGVGLLLFTHLIYAHTKSWVLYYLEGQPVVAFFVAVGALGLCQWPATENPLLRNRLGWRVAVGFRILVPVCLLASVPALPFWRATHREVESFRRQFRSALQILNGRPSVVFVRYRPGHKPQISLIANQPDVATAPIWVVRDLGTAENQRLLEKAGARQPWVFDECTGELTPWSVGTSAMDEADGPGRRCTWPKPG